jgi:hypothetical protein
MSKHLERCSGGVQGRTARLNEQLEPMYQV